MTQSEKIKYLKTIHDTITKHPDWYVDTMQTAGLAFNKYKKGLDHIKSDVLMGLMALTPKQAQKLLDTINKDMWHEDVIKCFKLRAENKGLGSWND